MAETTVLLIRHGAHGRVGTILCGRMPGITLGDLGRRQARALARHLGDLRPELIQTSPVERCRETAGIIAGAFAQEAETVPALTEIDFGAWTGCSFAELAGDPAWRFWNEQRDDARAPGGESAREAQTRALRHVAALRERHPGGTVALVSHADLIKSVLAHALGLPLQSYARFEISPGSVSRLLLREGGGVVLSMNEVPPA